MVADHGSDEGETPAIEIQDLWVKLGGTTVLEAIDLIGPEECLERDAPIAPGRIDRAAITTGPALHGDHHGKHDFLTDLHPAADGDTAGRPVEPCSLDEIF